MGLSRGKLLSQSTNGPHHRFLDFGLGERGFAAFRDASVNSRNEIQSEILNTDHRRFFGVGENPVLVADIVVDRSLVRFGLHAT